MPDFALPAYYILVCSEASSNLARYDGVRYGHRAAYADGLQSMYSHTRGEGFGSEVKRRILVGTYLLGDSHRQAYYEKALQVRQQVKRYFSDSFAKCDLILTPTAPVTAHRLGETSSEPMQMYRSDRFTVPASLAGLPAISVPCGVSKEGLPIGMQLIAPAFREDLLYRAAYAFEQEGGNGTV